MDWPLWILTAAVSRMPAERGEWGAAMRAELAHIQCPRKRWQFACGCARAALFPPGNGGFPMNDRMKHWLWAFAASAVFVLLVIGTNAYLETRERPQIRPGHMALRLIAQWLISTVVFTAIVYRRGAGEPQQMRSWFTTFGAAALFGLLAAGPFAFLEVWNNPRIRSGEFEFPFKLFLGLWTLPMMLFLTTTPIVRGLRAGEGVLAQPIAFALRATFLAFVSAMWLFRLWDQMPCFLGGVPGCD